MELKLKGAFGVSTLIDMHSKKVQNVNVKSSYCKACETWKKRQGDEEYKEWRQEHEKVCYINHEGSSGKVEFDAIKEMFARSEQLYGVRYTNLLETAVLKHSRKLSLLTEINVQIHKKKNVSDTYKNEWARVSENVRKKIKASVDKTN